MHTVLQLVMRVSEARRTDALQTFENLVGPKHAFKDSLNRRWGLTSQQGQTTGAEVRWVTRSRGVLDLDEVTASYDLVKHYRLLAIQAMQ
nr:hypothetical protein [Pseudomonas gozinkensis]